jgi:cell division protease FtsH
VDVKDLLAAVDIGPRNDDLTVEAARPQKRWVEHVGPVGRGDDDDALIGFKAVHLDEQLVERLLALVVAIAKDKVLMGTERKSMVMTEDEKRMTAYHEAGHAIVALHEPASDPIHKATIIPRGRALGMVMRLPERDSYSYHRDKMYANLAVAMGGRVAEEAIFGYDKVSSGASSDIQYATQLARDMVTRWGMSDALGPLQYAEPEEEVFLGYSVNRQRQMSNETAQAIDKEIRRVVEEGYERAKHLLDQHREQLEALAQALLEFETLSGDEIKKVLAGEAIDRGGSKGPSIPAAGSSIPKAKRPKAGTIGGPAAAGA